MSTALDALVHRELPAARGGDMAAFSRIVSGSQNVVTAIALAITRDVAASEDIAQEAYLSAWQNLQRLQNPSSFLPWLRQITRNLARDHLRAGQRGPRAVDDADAAIEAAADPARSPVEQLIEDERLELAAELISALPDDSREVLLLYYREDQRSQQVAALLGLSDAAVRKRLSRARAAVRAELLARVGDFARDSAPTVAFTTLVASVLTVASPPAAAAGVLGAGAAVGAKGALKIALGAAGSIGFAIVAGLAGIWLGLRRQLEGALDERERVGLVRSAVINGLASIGFMLVLVLMTRYTRGWIAPLLATLAFMAVIFHQTLVVQPRLLARRRAAEARRDPVGAAARRRRERLLCWAGVVVGAAGALGGLFYGVVQSGRL